MFLSGRPLALSAWRKFGLVVGLLGALGLPCLSQAKESLPDPAVVGLAELPKEAQLTDRLIRAGGPFPFRKDGIVFGNRERLLPAQPRGYYHEYTVKTLGSRDRGARRIVCGGNPPTAPQACYYSDDHYSSFRRIVQ